MPTSMLLCPLCHGPADSATKEGSLFLHVKCDGACQNDFLISSTATRQIGSLDKAERRIQMSKIVSVPLPENKIHVIAWRAADDDAEPSVESRGSWGRWVQ